MDMALDVLLNRDNLCKQCCSTLEYSDTSMVTSLVAKITAMPDVIEEEHLEQLKMSGSWKWRLNSELKYTSKLLKSQK